jgi:hypothetical protein
MTNVTNTLLEKTIQNGKSIFKKKVEITLGFATDSINDYEISGHQLDLTSGWAEGNSITAVVLKLPASIIAQILSQQVGGPNYRSDVNFANWTIGI